MPNLYVFDKDGTLVHPRKDGYVESPEDQILYEGVRDELDRLRSEGHVLAIASNQGGCDWHEVKVRSLNVGLYFRINHLRGYPHEKVHRVLRVEGVTDGIFLEAESSQEIFPNGEYEIQHTKKRFRFTDEDPVLVKYKTIEGAIAEMEFAADLCGITEAFLAPTMDGKTIVSLTRSDSKWHHQIENPSPESKYSFGGFRKPQPGMLLMPSYGYKYDRRIMIGDRDCDRESAAAAGFEFVWAEDWLDAQK